MQLQQRNLTTLLERLAAKWSIFVAAASFFVYVLGYVTLRSELTALGVGADLDLVSERYLFAGARFVFYLATTLPLALLCGLLLVAAGRGMLRLLPAVRLRLAAWWSRRTGPLLLGIGLGVAMIQLILRKCFAFDNLLLRQSLPEPSWFVYLLTSPSSVSAEWYFAGLLLGIAATASCAIALDSLQIATRGQRALVVILSLLISIELLLLPVNYGVLRSVRAIPRLAAGPAGLEHQEAWLIFQGPMGSTCFVRGNGADARLVTLPREQRDRIEIVGYDSLRVLRGESRPVPLPGGRSESQAAGLRSVLAQVAGFHASAMTWRTAELHELAQLGPVRGEILTVPSRGGTLLPVTAESDYSSPIYLPSDREILALRGQRLIRIDLTGGLPQELAHLPDVVKLIGVDDRASNRLLYIARSNGSHTVLEHDLESAQSRPVVPQITTGDQQPLEFTLGENRDYGACRLLVSVQHDPARQRWSDVFVQCDDAEQVQLTEGHHGVSYRQPSLSYDGRQVVLVRVIADR